MSKEILSPAVVLLPSNRALTTRKPAVNSPARGRESKPILRLREIYSMLTIRDLKMTLGGRVLFENAKLQINAGDRVALVGPNGAGKSTLFSIVLRQKEPDTGVVERDIWTSVGYLPQEAEAHGDETVLDVATGRVEELPRLEKLLRELEAAGDVSSAAYFEAHAKHDALADHDVETKAKKMLRGLGYRDADFNRPARDMSGGWIMRARLAKLLVMEPDLLLLDEPTNHLDLLSLLWLQKYLRNYSGALLLISHDRQFMDEIVTEVYDINEKKLIAYTGNY
ncbi:MAG: ATP-binding cassette domain-containing protein, partial [Verrucomicrobiota bacterium]